MPIRFFSGKQYQGVRHRAAVADVGYHSRTDSNGLLAERGLSRWLYTSVEILLNQAFNLPLNWNGLVWTLGCIAEKLMHL